MNAWKRFKKMRQGGQRDREEKTTRARSQPGVWMKRQESCYPAERSCPRCPLPSPHLRAFPPSQFHRAMLTGTLGVQLVPTCS